ncbi:MAG: hypothetical protein IPJ65_03750 [Archangiaceae bacterium]|nr:hypothetical protein [Archangiaceae bacterium]
MGRGAVVRSSGTSASAATAVTPSAARTTPRRDRELLVGAEPVPWVGRVSVLGEAAACA